MSLRLLGFESGAASTILVVGMAIVLLLIVVMAVARRRTNASAAVVSLVAAASSGIALASFVAVRYFGQVLADMSQHGGGIGALTLGIGEAAQLPLSAAWIAATATAVASLFALKLARSDAGSASDGQPVRLLWMSALALAGGIASVLLFRGAMAFVMMAVTPGMQSEVVRGRNVGEAISERLMLATVTIAFCFAVAIAQVILTLRLPRHAVPSRAAGRIAVAALVVSLFVSAALVASLRSYSGRYVSFALHGSVSGAPWR